MRAGESQTWIVSERLRFVTSRLLDHQLAQSLTGGCERSFTIAIRLRYASFVDSLHRSSRQWLGRCLHRKSCSRSLSIVLLLISHYTLRYSQYPSQFKIIET